MCWRIIFIGIENLDVNCCGYGNKETVQKTITNFKEGKIGKGISYALISRIKAMIHLPTKVYILGKDIFSGTIILLLFPLTLLCPCCYVKTEDNEVIACLFLKFINTCYSSALLNLVNLPGDLISIISPEIAVKIFKIHKIEEARLKLITKIFTKIKKPETTDTYCFGKWGRSKRDFKFHLIQ